MLVLTAMSSSGLRDAHRRTTSSPARPSPSTCPRPSVGAADRLRAARRAATLGASRFAVLFLAAGRRARTPTAPSSTSPLVCSLIVVFLVYPTTVETLTRGKSPGKLALGLRVVRDDGGTVTAQQSFVRALIGIAEIYVLIGGPAFFSCLVSSRGKRIGDYAAGTYVVRDRVRLSLPPPPPMPPALAAWAAPADLRTPPVGLALATRQYLARLPTLDPASRRAPGRAARRTGCRRTSPRHRRRAPRRGTSSPRSARSAASATSPGCIATSRCALGWSTAAADPPCAGPAGSGAAGRRRRSRRRATKTTRTTRARPSRAVDTMPRILPTVTSLPPLHRPG